ncbi:uncharacterized protein LOC143260300, partial [Megalopta genalis]|uniref:uncharacterized protein LOC143260300 n=1 Tax=Megalopta genalis TaxID=115081 RepID=UPI003FD45D5E
AKIVNEKINGYLCDSRESNVVLINLVAFLQFNPKTYLTPPVLFPFSTRSCGILGASRIHRITGNGEIVSRIVPNECCWFPGQQRCGGSRIEDNLVNCTAFLDCSHRARDKEWFGRSGTVVHPSGMQAMLRQRENYESYGTGRNDGSYILISAGRSSNNASPRKDDPENENDKRMTLMIEEEGSPKCSNTLPTKDKQDI